MIKRVSEKFRMRKLLLLVVLLGIVGSVISFAPVSSFAADTAPTCSFVPPQNLYPNQRFSLTFPNLYNSDNSGGRTPVSYTLSFFDPLSNQSGYTNLPVNLSDYRPGGTSAAVNIPGLPDTNQYSFYLTQTVQSKITTYWCAGSIRANPGTCLYSGRTGSQISASCAPGYICPSDSIPPQGDGTQVTQNCVSAYNTSAGPPGGSSGGSGGSGGSTGGSNGSGGSGSTPLPTAVGSFNPLHKCDNGTEGVQTELGCLPSNPSNLVNAILRILMGLAGGAAILLIIIGGYKVATSQGDPDALEEGRNMITAAIIGLVFVLLASVILGIIGVDILGISFFQKSGNGVTIKP